MMTKQELQQAKRLNELRGYVEFFSEWFGFRWERKVETRIGVRHQHILQAVQQHIWVSQELLERLGRLKAELTVGVAAGDARRSPSQVGSSGSSALHRL
jgi:hypothetical protein